jgi:hypothetical protein
LASLFHLEVFAAAAEMPVLEGLLCIRSSSTGSDPGKRLVRAFNSFNPVEKWRQ